MNIDFELYRIFYTVANKRNITKASEELHISQPAISKSIKHLEEQLGGQLFIRTTRGVMLTEEGKEFYNYIKQAIEYITSAENKFTELINLETGCIKIGISTTLTQMFLLPILEKFHRQYKNIKLEIITNMTSELIQKLRSGLIDMVILNLNNHDYGKDIDIIRCKKVHDCFIVNEKYIDLTNEDLPLNDLNNYPLILQANGSNMRRFLDDFALKNKVVLKPNMELTSYKLVVEFAKIGLGIGYATREFIQDELKKHELYELRIKEKIPNRYIGIALCNNHLPNFSTKKLIEMIKE